MRANLLAAALCLVLWESGPVRLPSEVAPQTPIIEWRAVYCPGRAYHMDSGFSYRPGAVKIEQRMRLGPATWQDAAGPWEVPEGLWELAPHTGTGIGGWNGP